MGVLSLVALLIATVAANSVPAESEHGFNIFHLYSHTPSGRGTVNWNYVSFDVQDTCTGTNASCFQKWDSISPIPLGWTSCNDPTFAWRFDEYLGLVDFDIQISHTVDATTSNDTSTSDETDTCVKIGDAEFTRFQPKWTYSCGGSGVCNAGYSPTQFVPFTNETTCALGHEEPTHR